MVSFNYFASLANRYPLLTASQEIEYGTIVQNWLAMENPTPRDVKRGQRAVERMILSNLRMVGKVVNKHTNRLPARPGIDVDDLLQEGVIGLDKAARKFDPTLGYKFSTYAYWWISQAITRCVHKDAYSIHIPRKLQLTMYRWTIKPDNQTLDEFAEEWSLCKSTLAESLRLGHNASLLSLDKVTERRESQSDPLLEMITDGECALERLAFDDHCDRLFNWIDGVAPKFWQVRQLVELEGYLVRDALQHAGVTRETYDDQLKALKQAKGGVMEKEVKELLATAG
nr:hypothetical protein 11 [Alphaproteobacteria bacterium]